METQAYKKVSRENWFEDHPKFKEICSYGFNKDDDPGLLRSAMMVYLDLCETKGWFKVELHPCESLKQVYITGKPRKKAPLEVIVPITVQTALTMADFQNVVFETNSLEEERLVANSVPSVTLAISEADSTIVYYTISSGLVPPEEPTEEELQMKAQKKQKRKRNKRN